MRATATVQTARAPLWTIAAQVLGSPGRKAGFVVVAAAVSLLYTILLPFGYTQQFGLANWHYLDPYLGVWSVVLGGAMGFVLMVQVYAMRRVAAARADGRSGLAFVASLLPGFLCCTPIIPTLLAFIGVSGASLYTTTGTLAHFFATQQTDFLAATLALLVLTGLWGLRRVAAADCLSEVGCSPTDLSASRDHITITPIAPGGVRAGSEDGGQP